MLANPDVGLTKGSMLAMLANLANSNMSPTRGSMLAYRIDPAGQLNTGLANISC